MSEGVPVRHQRATLPPPDWAPPASVRARATEVDEVIERHAGPKAEEAELRGRVIWARRRGEPGELRAAATTLARHLAARERDLREAASLAMEVLEGGDDGALRTEAASWLETLGEVDAAAELLTSGAPDAPTLARIGVLRARSGHADLASLAFGRAAKLDPADAMSLELRAMLASGSPDVLDARAAADAYVEAATRRREAGALAGELEDLLRAFELDPTGHDVVEALAAALVARGRAVAAEEVRRVTASTFEGSARLGEHLRRFESALTAGDALRALDAGLASELDTPVEGSMVTALGTGLDDVLLRVGLFELLAARLEIAAERARGRERAVVFEQLARLCAGPLASPSRAARAHVQTLAADPTREEPLLALRAYAAATRDMVPLVEGLVRGARCEDDPRDREGRLRCARTLASLAEGQLGDAQLARWAYRIVAELEPEEVGGADALRRLAALGEEDKAWRAALEQELTAPTRGQGGLGRWLLGQELVAPDEVEARVNLAAAARARADLAGAREIVRPLADQEQPTLRGLAIAWVNAGLAGDARLVARAMVRMAALCAPAVQSILLCEAADRFARAGDRDAARRAAERACQAEPTAPRPVATLAQVAMGSRDRTAVSALERAVATVFARGAWCEELADALEELGEVDYCVAWTQRLVALRPGDTKTLRTLLRRVELAKDAARLADTLVWALPQPRARAELLPLVADGLTSLALLDAGRASVVARRALDTFGPNDERLRAVIGAVADRAGDDGLAATLEERWADIDPARAGDLWRSVARHRSVLGDREGEARAIVRALRAGTNPRDLEAAIGALEGQTRSGDGVLLRLEARARLLAAKEDQGAAARAWRDLGGAFWDLADDRESAIAAWCHGARLVRVGYVRLAADLVRFGGAQFALGRLVELVEAEREPDASGALAAEAARVALSLGEPARAFELAQLALIRNGLLTDVLEVAEKGAVASGRASEMSRLYDAVATGALGRFGRRSAHYRGARFFEQRSEHDLALKHAAQAFLAVPSEGATLLLLERIADAAEDRPTAVRTVVEVARGTRSPGARAAWLLRAAAIAGGGEEAARLSVDVLLEAALLVPSMSTLSRLAEAARELLRLAPDERDALQMRFSRASKTLTARQEGPDGARVALAFADLGLAIFDDADGALAAIEHALAADADIEEYITLVPRAGVLARGADARGVLSRGAALVDQPYSNVGTWALRLLGAIAREVGDALLSTQFLLRAAEREPDDDALVCEADALAKRGASDPACEAAVARFEKKLSRARRVEALAARAASDADAGRLEAAVPWLERAVELAEGGERAAIEQKLRSALEAAGRLGDLEQRARRAAMQEDAPPATRASRWLEIAHMLEERGDVAGAADAVLAAAELDPSPLEPWSALERLASLSGRSELRVRALREIEARVREEARPAVLRRLARAHEEAGDLDGVEAAWMRVLEQSPDDEEADQELESVLARRGDYERLSQHLARRADRLSRVAEYRETLRVVRLRRVAILEQRLGRIDEACAELERLTAEWPDNESALRYLADLHERGGRHAKAAPVWRHLATLARDETTRIDLELRAALAARTAGDTIHAAQWTREILDRSPGNVDALALLAELARASSDDATLGVALAGLAVSPLEDPLQRSGWLIEAAQAAARAGDAEAALERAQSAAKIAPERAETQLFARGLEYRLRGPGTEEQAQATVAELARVAGPVVGDDGALLAFLWAEALDVIGPASAGLDVLEQARAKMGDHALVSVAIAERLLAARRFDEALAHLQIAVNGNLLGLRSRGRVAMTGADAAMRAGAQTVALRMLEIAAREADTTFEASLRLAALEAELGDLAHARELLERVAAERLGEERAQALAHLSRLLFAAAAAEDGRDAMQRAMDAAPAGSVLFAQLETELAVLARGPAAPRPEDATPAAPPSDAVMHAHAKIASGHIEDAIQELNDALAAGSVDAGEELIALYGEVPDRLHEVVKVRRAQLELRPGDPALLAALRSAALADRNIVWARAIDHVARAFDRGAGPVAAPPLWAQVEQPGLLEILTKKGVGAEALALVWEGAGSVLARAPQSYSITGVERVVPGPTSAISRLYESAIRLLGVPNIPLYVRRPSPRAPEETSGSDPRLAVGPDAPRVGVALLASPSAMLTGDVREDTPVVRFALGRALGAALPQSALVFGLPEQTSRAVWAAVIASFGPPAAARGGAAAPESARWTTTFWSTIPGRLQRRLQELLGNEPPSYLDVAGAALEATRRVGLFLAGDLAAAVTATCAELGLQVPDSTEELAATASAAPAVADLLRLAVRPEYADARWRNLPESSPRATLSSGRFRLT